MNARVTLAATARSLAAALWVMAPFAWAQSADPGWPRVFKKDGEQLTVYQPQVDYWHGYTNLHFRSAIALKGVLKNEKFGVAEVEALTVTDHGARAVAIVPVTRDLRFPGVTESELEQLRLTVNLLKPMGEATTLSLDRVIAYLDPAAHPTQHPAELKQAQSRASSYQPKAQSRASSAYSSRSQQWSGMESQAQARSWGNQQHEGAEGKVQKIPLTSPPPQERKRGLRGRIAEAKKEEMTDFMKSAVALVKEYIPPDPVLIQKAKDAGNVAVSPLQGQRARLALSNYLKPGDSVALVLDLASNRPVEAKVSTYLDSKEEAVVLDVRFDTLEGGATYASNVTLDAPSKHLGVTVENSGYRRQ